MARLIKLRARRVLAHTQALDSADLLWVGTHHKMMTTYFTAVMRLFAFGTNLRYDSIPYHTGPTRGQLVVATHSTLEVSALGRHRGVHVFRDPCDAIVSGYHYHKWCHEIWANTPDEHGETYRQKINRLSKRDGLFCEIDQFLRSYEWVLRDWNVGDPHILELRFEDLMGPSRVEFYERLFCHLGFDSTESALGVDLMRSFEAANRTGRRGSATKATHVSPLSRMSRRDELDPDHLAYLHERLGDVFDKFGYPPPGAHSAAA